MILSPDEIKKYILNPKNKYIIDYQVRLKQEHELHLTGIGLDNFIEKVDHIENESYLQVKKKLKNAITVKAFEKVLRPKDKILTAKGGSIIYEFSDSNKDKEKLLKDALKDLSYKGYSLQGYTHQIWLDYGIWIDPMGLTLVEYVMDEKITEDGIILEKTDKLKLNYISIYERINGTEFINYHDIDYTSFDNIDYLILNEGEQTKATPKKEIKYNVYRVIDEEKDEIWLQEKDDTNVITLKEGSTIYHEFGKVPAVFNSNRVDKKSTGNKTGFFTTYCAESLIVAKDYLNDYIDYRIYKKKLGIPRYWEFKTICQTCNGEGTILNTSYGEENQPQYVTCNSCNGKNYNSERVLTDITYLDILQGESQSNVPPSGAVTLPTDIQEQLRKELDEMEFDLAEVVWGQGSAVDKERRDTTAFEVSVRNEGKIDKLRMIEHNKAEWQTAIINLFGQSMFESSFKGVIITPDTQFIMLTPTESRQVYLESKKASSPNYQLDKLYNDYLLSEYESDPISLEKNKIIVLLTPLPHLNIIEAWDMLTPEEKIIKKNLEKFIFRYENEENKSILIVMEDGKMIKEINDKFIEYANEILTKQETDGISIQQNTERPTEL